MASRRTKRARRGGAARVDIQKGVEQLARSVAQIDPSLRDAERTIEANARDRVRQLRIDTREQLAVLRGYEREAFRIVTRLSTVADGSWGDLKGAADHALKNARKVAVSMIKRFRRVASE
jgi:hypothetical protein